MMDDDRITEFIIKVESKLSSIETKVDGIVAQLQDHAKRIGQLEQGQGQGQGLKTNLLEFALKAIIGLITVVIALTGAGGILTKFIGQ